MYCPPVFQSPQDPLGSLCKHGGVRLHLLRRIANILSLLHLLTSFTSFGNSQDADFDRSNIRTYERAKSHNGLSWNVEEGRCLDYPPHAAASLCFGPPSIPNRQLDRVNRRKKLSQQIERQSVNLFPERANRAVHIIFSPRQSVGNHFHRKQTSEPSESSVCTSSSSTVNAQV